MNIGFTGTRRGMTAEQKSALGRVLLQLLSLSSGSIHHGDCIGADDEFATMVHKEHPSARIICHPPSDATHRAFNPHADETRNPFGYFVRNRNIVNSSEIVIGTPCERTHQPRGGTWYTLDFASKKGRPTIIIWPNGTTSTTDPECEYQMNLKAMRKV